MPAGGVTQIDANYLNALKGQLQDLKTKVEAQINGLGTSGTSSATTNYINPVGSLTLLAGPAGFDAGKAINDALKTMGGSVHDQLEWLDKVLKDMINEIITTVNSFSGTESLNNDAVDKLVSDFQNTVNDINNPAGSSTPNPNTSPH